MRMLMLQVVMIRLQENAEAMPGVITAVTDDVKSQRAGTGKGPNVLRQKDAWWACERRCEGTARRCTAWLANPGHQVKSPTHINERAEYACSSCAYAWLPSNMVDKAADDSTTFNDENSAHLVQADQLEVEVLGLKGGKLFRVA